MSLSGCGAAHIASVSFYAYELLQVSLVVVVYWSSGLNLSQITWDKCWDRQQGEMICEHLCDRSCREFSPLRWIDKPNKLMFLITDNNLTRSFTLDEYDATFEQRIDALIICDRWFENLISIWHAIIALTFTATNKQFVRHCGVNLSSNQSTQIQFND